MRGFNFLIDPGQVYTSEDPPITVRGQTTKGMCAEDTYAYHQTEPSVHLRQQDLRRQRTYAVQSDSDSDER